MRHGSVGAREERDKNKQQDACARLVLQVIEACEPWPRLYSGSGSPLDDEPNAKQVQPDGASAAGEHGAEPGGLWKRSDCHHQAGAENQQESRKLDEQIDANVQVSKRSVRGPVAGQQDSLENGLRENAAQPDGGRHEVGEQETLMHLDVFQRFRSLIESRRATRLGLKHEHPPE